MPSGEGSGAHLALRIPCELAMCSHTGAVTNANQRCGTMHMSTGRGCMRSRLASLNASARA